MTVGVVVPAAGAGTRLGPGAPKALRQVGGEPLLVHAVRRLRAAPSVGPIAVAAPGQAVADVTALLSPWDVAVVAGGAARHDSVAAGLSALPPEVDFVLVHDAARAFVPVSVVEAVVAALRAGAPAVVPVLRVADTVKRVAADVVVETVDRAELRSVQTPQGFARRVLEQAHAAGRAATDDAGMVEALGVKVTTVAGSPAAFKVTTTFDLLVAEALLREGAHADGQHFEGG